MEFLYNKSTSPNLTLVKKTEILERLRNPLTNKPYEGMILFGEFISFDVINNNNRFYTSDNFLAYLGILKQTALSEKGLYGELEHPQQYAINYNNISHKIIDFWYEPQSKKVYGYVMLLNTPKGKIAQEIIKSGGQMGISVRSAGLEHQQPDGTLKSEVRLIITFDLVNHPGFNESIMKYEKEANAIKDAHVYPQDNTLLVESTEYIRFEKPFIKNIPLFESSQQSDLQIMQRNESSDKQEIEENLQMAVEMELKESEKAICECISALDTNNYEQHKKQRDLAVAKILND